MTFYTWNLHPFFGQLHDLTKMIYEMLFTNKEKTIMVLSELYLYRETT